MNKSNKSFIETKVRMALQRLELDDVDEKDLNKVYGYLNEACKRLYENLDKGNRTEQ
jgi:hypothetical protein